VTQEPAAVLARLGAALAESSLVDLAVLFGSRARGTARTSSDYDIGVLPRAANILLKAELELAARLSSLAEAEVELVRLDGDDPLLGREVAVHGICLFEAEPGRFAAYRAAAASRWIDFDETIAPYRHAFLRRLAGT
jgi:uncharacterized protein